MTDLKAELRDHGTDLTVEYARAVPKRLLVRSADRIQALEDALREAETNARTWETVAREVAEDRDRTVAAAEARLARALEALKPFAKIKADDGDNFGSYPPETVIRCEVTAGEIQTARATLGEP